MQVYLQDLSRAASQLNDATGEVVQGAKTSPAQLAGRTKQFGAIYGDVLEAGMGMAGQTQVRVEGLVGFCYCNWGMFVECLVCVVRGCRFTVVCALAVCRRVQISFVRLRNKFSEMIR